MKNDNAYYVMSIFYNTMLSIVCNAIHMRFPIISNSSEMLASESRTGTATCDTYRWDVESTGPAVETYGGAWQLSLSLGSTGMVNHAYVIET